MGNRRNNLRFNYGLQKSSFWGFALTVFFAISMNNDWRMSYFLWYGSIFLLVFAYLVAFNGYIPRSKNSFLSWFLIFILFSLASTSWALSSTVVVDVIKSLVVWFFALIFIHFSLSFDYKVDDIIKMFFIATLVNAVYILVEIDLLLLRTRQYGSDEYFGWNANGVGFMLIQGALFGLYLYSGLKKKTVKVLMIICLAFLSILTIYTGSRTAFIGLVASFICYIWLSDTKKLFRNALITILVLAISIYLVFNVESLYQALGQRLEGLLALLSGKGDIDSSSAIRDTFMRNGKEWFRLKPLLGYGLNNYKVLNLVATDRFTYSHNTYIEIAVGLGLIGLILYYSIYVYLIVFLFKNFKKSKLNLLFLTALLVSLICQYGTVCYYDFYQNLLLLLCFYVVEKQKKIANKQNLRDL